MVIVSSPEVHSKSPITRDREGSISQRTMDSQYQDPVPLPRSRRHLPNIPRPDGKSSAQATGKARNHSKNTSSLSNPLLTPSIVNAYSYGALTPEKPDRPNPGKRVLEQADMQRRGNIDRDQSKSPARSLSKDMKLKIDFVSNISGLPGSARNSSPGLPVASLESYRARGLMPSGSETERPARNRSIGKEQWRSSCDFIKHIVTTKTYY